MVSYNNFFNIFFLINVIFHCHHIFISSKIVIPFNYFKLNSDSFIANYFQNSLYTEIQSGTYKSYPEGKKIGIFLNLKKSSFKISNYKICPQTSFYNRNESLTYKNISKFLSEDSFYFYNDIEPTSIQQCNYISFQYDEKNEGNNFCGDMGFSLLNTFDDEKGNILYNLKQNNYINNYFVSFYFKEKRDFDNYDNLKGEIVLGELPHEYIKDKFYPGQLRFGSVNLELIKNYNLVFDKVYAGLKDKEINILEEKTEKNNLYTHLEISYGLISGPYVYQNYIEENFFNKTDITSLCKKTIDYGNNLDYSVYICDTGIKNKFNLFPDLKFYHKDFDYNFTFTYKDLFMLRNNQYYFKIIFLGSSFNSWRIGLPLFLKYQLVLNQDTKQIGFYNDNIKVNKEENNNGSNSKFIWIIFAIVIVALVIIAVFAGKYIFGNNIRRKKANELDDGFDYEAHKETKNENNNEDKNKLFENEENN